MAVLDERLKIENSKINTIILLITAVMGIISIIIKAFFVEFGIIQYGAELAAIGIGGIYGLIFLIILLKNKRLDERLSHFLLKAGTFFLLSIYFLFLVFLIANLVMQIHSLVVIPYVVGSGGVGNLLRVFMTKTVSNKACAQPYAVYKKKTIKTWAIVCAICFACGIALIILGAVLQNMILVMSAFLIMWLAIPTCIFSPILYLRVRKFYDNDTNENSDSNNEN